jgi:hypothetical protein
MSTNKSLDSKLNKTALDCVLFSAVGLGIGVVASLFFKNKAYFLSLIYLRSIRANFVGLGAGIALS